MTKALMAFDPATGEEKPYPSHAEQWRTYHGQTAWLFNPWTGARRKAEDVGTDCHGHAIATPGPSVAAEEKPKFPYGFCPTCGNKGISREKRIDGYDRCVRAHTYLSSTATAESIL